MTKNYYLYLDESGDFDGDLKDSWKNECLVGGLLLEGNPADEKKIQSLLVKCWKMQFPGDSQLSEDKIIKKINHSTDLGENKVKIVKNVLDEAEKLGAFIIFENYNKARILNSTVTYVNIMADGIVQLLGQLALQNPKDKISLRVNAGFRKDTTKEVSSDPILGYIGSDECTGRIRERIALLKLKNAILVKQKSEVFFEYKDDKKVMPLILADYICNFYYTNSARIYREKCSDEKSYREYLLDKFREEYIFSLAGNSERERMTAYLNVQDYGTALYEICVNLIKEQRNINSFIQAFVQLPDLVQVNQLQNFENYINNMVSIERRTSDDTLSILDRAIELLNEIQRRGGSDTTASIFALLLYKLDVHNHRGELLQMQQLFEECKKKIGIVGYRIEHLKYMFKFYNRYAVYLNDRFKMKEANELIEGLKTAFDALEVAVSEFPYWREQAVQITSDQKAKLLGTQVQACYRLMRLGECNYEYAVKISNEAIENFSMEADRKRQKQYRAHVEMEAGHYEKAKQFLMDGCGFDSLEEFFGVRKNQYAFYHLSEFIKRFCDVDDENKQQEVKRIAGKFEKIKDVFDSKQYPDFVTLGNVAEVLARCGKERRQAEAWYSKAIKADEQTILLFKVYKLCIAAGYTAWLISTGAATAAEQVNSLLISCRALQKQGLPEGLFEVMSELQNTLVYEPDAEALYKYSRLI